MYSGTPTLSIKIDKILLKGSESSYSLSERNIFYDSKVTVENSYGEASFFAGDTTEKLSDADRNFIEELDSVLSEDEYFTSSNETDNTSSLSKSIVVNNAVNIETSNDSVFDCLSIDEPSKVLDSFLNSQSQVEQSISKDSSNRQLIDLHNTFSTQIYNPLDGSDDDFIYDGILDETYFVINESERENLRMIRELKVVLPKLSDAEISSYVERKSSMNDKTSYHSILSKEVKIVLKKMTSDELKSSMSDKTNYHSILPQEVKIVLKKMTSDEINSHVDAKINTNNKNMNVRSQSTKNNLSYGKKRKMIEQDLDCKFQGKGKVFIRDRDQKGFKDIEEAVKSCEVFKEAGTITIFQNEIILKRSARIYNLTFFKILIAGKFAYHDDYEQTIKNFGGKVVSDPEIATVLVAKKIRRTLEILIGICRGIPIVSVDWIHECVDRHQFVDPYNYLLTDTVSEEKYGFTLMESLKRAQKKRVFEGYSFLATSGIKEIISYDRLKYLIKSAGGNVYKNYSKNMKPHKIIVSCPADKTKVKSIIKRNENCFERVVTIDFIIYCIIRQEICNEKHLHL